MMVVAVLERRVEIGVRRALGATKRHIRLQFLVEALLLALLGGVLGVMIGVGVTAGYTNVRDMVSVGADHDGRRGRRRRARRRGASRAVARRPRRPPQPRRRGPTRLTINASGNSSSSRGSRATINVIGRRGRSAKPGP